MQNTFFNHVIHLQYIFHSCTVSKNNGNLNFPNYSYLAFCFLLSAFLPFSRSTLLQLGVSQMTFSNFFLQLSCIPYVNLLSKYPYPEES